MQPSNQARSFDRQTVSIFWRAARRERRLFAIALLFPIGGLILSVIVPFFISKLIAATVASVGGAQSAADPMHYAPYLLVAALAGVAANRIGAPALFRLQSKNKSYLQELAFSALVARSMGFHNDRVGGKLVSDATDYPSSFSQLTDAVFTNLLPFVVIILSGSIIVYFESWQLGLVITVMSVYAVGSAYYSSRKNRHLRNARLKASKQVTAHLADSIVNIPTVKTFAHESSELLKHQQLNDVLLKTRIKSWLTGANEGNTRITVVLAMELVFIFALSYMIQRDPSLLGIGIFGFSFITLLSSRLFLINAMIRQIEEALLNASPMTEILLEQPEVRDADGAQPLQVSKGAIDFADIHFRYRDESADQQVFDKLLLHIKPGEKVGLVGPSGGGKSTLTRLLLRFEDIDGGMIAIDGQNIANVTQASLRRNIAYVPQEPLLFHRSIAENIAYGRMDATPQQIEAAARQAHAHEFIQGLAHGYDTIVGERGVKLSGGQRQRIAIARAILKDAPILVLDEATSALDSESEVYIQDALWKLMQDRTAMVIAHRLSTVQKLDRIIVLENGRISEEGNHAQLLKQNGTYARLWNHQSGGFIED